MEHTPYTVERMSRRTKGMSRTERRQLAEHRSGARKPRGSGKSKKADARRARRFGQRS